MWSETGSQTLQTAQVFHCREVYSGFSPDWQRGGELEKLENKNLEREKQTDGVINEGY